MNEKTHNLIRATVTSIDLSYNEKSKIDNGILEIRGMSTPKVRHLMNNICNEVSKTNICNYLEVGTFRGSTLCSSIFQNKLGSVYALDNFSEFFDQQDKECLYKNIETFSSGNIVSFIEKDFFKTDLSNIKDINVYLYDGSHDDYSQYKNLELIKNSLSDSAIILVDDWFSGICNPRPPTFKGFNDFGYNIHFFAELPKTYFHQGLGIFVITK